MPNTLFPLQKILNIGHRGAKGHLPENTLTSFQKAFELGADGIELDVHVCKTGELIVIHDFTADRTTNGSGAVSDLSLSEIKALKIEENSQVPTLEEVVQLCQGKGLVNIELKGRHTAGPVAALIAKYVFEKGYRYSDFLVSSFQSEALEVMFETNRKIPLAILTQASVAQAMEWGRKFSAKAIHPHFSLLTESNVAKAQEAGFLVNTWTVNDAEDISRVKSYKVNGIITDFPEKL